MKVILLGARGQLGRCLQDRFPSEWEVLITDSDTLDISDADSVDKVVSIFKPHVIVNAAAYTAVDQAEEEVHIARQINVEGPRNLALAAKKNGSLLIHVSTDYVFDGFGTRPYIEDDIKNPLGAYGQTKLDGEIAVSQILTSAIIIRTSWVFSEYGKNFVKTMLKLAKFRSELSIVDDQRGCPTYAGDIAETIITLICNKVTGDIYHFCGNEEVSWYNFAQTIFDEAYEIGLSSQKPLLFPINSKDYPTPASRPNYSTLSCEKIKRKGITPSEWRKSLKYVLNRWSVNPELLD